MSDVSEYHSTGDPSENPSASITHKPSGMKQPSGIPSLSKVSRICSNHDKKAELPVAATPKKNVSEESENDLYNDRYGLGSRSSKSKSPDSFRLFKYSPDRKSSSGVSSVSPDFFEATGRRSSSDHGGDLTIDTDSFMIGQRVYVGGVKSGRITFIGEVHFAPGDWAGIVLDEPEGKNDGAVSGKRYFQCEPKKGIFSRLTRLTREPLTPETPFSMDSSFRSMSSPLRMSSGNTSPTQSVTSTTKGSKLIPEVNDRVIVKSAAGSKIGVLRYKGEPNFASGIWCGVEFDEAVGKNDGSVSGQRYFKCDPNHGLFVPAAKVEISPLARKFRLSRQNSQESLFSNLTLGSMTSTNTSKLRMNATQKRLSTLNKTQLSATSTPKTSFSLQDILREKSNHIEKIIKERETDREEMAAQTILFQKNIEQHKDKIAHLQKLLEDEKKKSEDLQFSIDEAQAQTEENEIVLRRRVLQLEEQLKALNSQAAGDYVDISQNDEITKLKADLEDKTRQLYITEGLKKSLENEIQNLHQKVAEMKIEIDMKISGDQASEAVLKEEISYFSQRVETLETELDSKSKDLETQKDEIKKIESSRKEELTILENQTKEKLASMVEKIAEKEKTIEQLKTDVENLSKSDAGTQNLIKSKNDELSMLSEAAKILEEKSQHLQSELDKKSSEIILRDEEILNLKKSIESQKTEVESFNLSIQQHKNELQQKEEEIIEHKKSHDTLNLELVEYKFQIDHLQNSLKKSEESSIKFKDSLDTLSQKVTELSESKAKLEQDLNGKDNEVQNAKEQINKLMKEKDEIQQSISGLSNDAESKINLINEKNAAIEKLTKDLNEMKERNQSDLNELQTVKNTLEDQILLYQKSSEEQIQKLHIDYDSEKKKMSSVIEELNIMIREKDARIDVMNKNSSLLTEKKSELEARVSEFEIKYSDSFMKLTKIEKEDSEKANQLEKLQNIYDETIKKLHEAEITNKNLLDDKNSAEVDNKDLNRKLGAQEEKISQLNEQKIKLQQDIEYLKNTSHNNDDTLKKLHEELTASQGSFESLQSRSKSVEFELHKRIDELENQRDLVRQQCDKLSTEINTIQRNKVESENNLNHELASIKQSTEEERRNLESEIVKLKGIFESEKAQLKRESHELLEASERTEYELEAKIKSLKENLEDIQNELKSSQDAMKQSESRMGVAIDELKAKESQLTSELNKEKDTTDQLKLTLEELEASKTILRDEYENKLFIEKSKTATLEGQLKAQVDNLIAASVGNEEKIKFLDEIQRKCYDYEQQINLLNQQVQHENSLKEKLESGMKELQNRLKLIEEEQVDLVHRKEEYKAKSCNYEEEIKSLQQRRKSLDEKLSLERKESEVFKTESEIKMFEMQKKLNELHQATAAKDFEKEEILKRLQLRESDISELHASIKQQEEKIRLEIESTLQLVKNKDNELTKMVHECSTKDNLIADLKNNLDNMKTCLKNVASEKDSTTDVMQTLNETIAQRETALNEIKMRLQQMESSIVDKERQLENAFALKEKLESESRTQINDLMEQISILEDVKEKENQDWSRKLDVLESQLSLYQSEAEASTSSIKLNQKHGEKLLLKIKDLEISETELKIANQTLKRQIEQLQSIGNVPKVEGDAEGQDLVEHIEFLNSIIADMHKKNLKLSKQVQVLETGPSSSKSYAEHELDLSFLDKKKPTPRMYCDICEEFDAHETEDCPTQCSSMDPDAPAPNKNGKKKKAIIRKYCDNCEIFDAHDTEDCPNDETF